MDDDDLLERTLEVVKALRADLHGRTESSVVGRIDEVITLLELAQRDRSKRVRYEEIVLLLGLALDAVPAIASLIDLVCGK